MSKKKTKKSPHAGHRERVRNRFLASGFDGFADHEILEYLLFHTIQRCNTNESAHCLIETFGSLPAVLDASYEELMKVQGINHISATFITSLPELFRLYCLKKEEIRDRYDTVNKLTRYCHSLFVGSTVEQVYLLLFDNGMHLIDCTLISHGTVNSAPVITRRIAEKALEKHASFVVITHNHPDGMAIPSREDLEITAVIEEALAIFKIPLLEHILVTATDTLPLMYQKQGLRREEGTKSKEFFKAFYELKESEESANPSASL